MKEKLKGYLAQLKGGILDNNPALVQLLGMCPTLAVTTNIIVFVKFG